MSKVYVVVHDTIDFNHEEGGWYVRGVFSSLEKAEAFIDIYALEHPKIEKYDLRIQDDVELDPECSETSAKVDELIRFVRDVASGACRERCCDSCAFCRARGLLHKYGELG